jgi:hypothetical protein
MDSETNALQNGACTNRCISKQMHHKPPFLQNGFMKSLEFYENNITLTCVEKNKLFDDAALLKTITYRAIKTTGTIIVNINSGPCVVYYPKWLK